MTDHDDSACTSESRFRAGLDDVIIIPLVCVALAANKSLRLIFSILVRLFDYAFPFAMQAIWLPLLAVKLIGDVVVSALKRALGFLPLSELRRRRWRRLLRRNWSWFRRKISYRA